MASWSWNKARSLGAATGWALALGVSGLALFACGDPVVLIFDAGADAAVGGSGGGLGLGGMVGIIPIGGSPGTSGTAGVGGGAGSGGAGSGGTGGRDAGAVLDAGSDAALDASQ